MLLDAMSERQKLATIQIMKIKLSLNWHLKCHSTGEDISSEAGTKPGLEVVKGNSQQETF